MIYTLCISIGYKSDSSVIYYAEQRVYLCNLKHDESQSEDHLWESAYDVLELIHAELPLTKSIIEPINGETETAHFVNADIRCLTHTRYSYIHEAILTNPIFLTSYDIAFETLEDFEEYSQAIETPEGSPKSFKAKFLRI